MILDSSLLIVDLNPAAENILGIRDSLIDQLGCRRIALEDGIAELNRYSKKS